MIEPGEYSLAKAWACFIDVSRYPRALIFLIWKKNKHTYIAMGSHAHWFCHRFRPPSFHRERECPVVVKMARVVHGSDVLLSWYIMEVGAEETFHPVLEKIRDASQDDSQRWTSIPSTAEQGHDQLSLLRRFNCDRRTIGKSSQESRGNARQFKSTTTKECICVAHRRSQK